MPFLHNDLLQVALKRVEGQMFRRKVFKKATKKTQQLFTKNNPAVTYTCTNRVQHTDNKN